MVKIAVVATIVAMAIAGMVPELNASQCITNLLNTSPPINPSPKPFFSGRSKSAMIGIKPIQAKGKILNGGVPAANRIPVNAANSRERGGLIDLNIPRLRIFSPQYPMQQ